MSSNETFLRQPISDQDDVLDLPDNPTPRFCHLKLAQLKVETKCREETSGHIQRLENLFVDETEKSLLLKKSVEKQKREQENNKRVQLNHERESRFYKEKLSQSDGLLEKRFADLQVQLRQLQSKKDELNNVYKGLEKFKGVPPTNEAIKRKIDDLKKARLSLDLTFAD